MLREEQPRAEPKTEPHSSGSSEGTEENAVGHVVLDGGSKSSGSRGRHHWLVLHRWEKRIFELGIEEQKFTRQGKVGKLADGINSTCDMKSERTVCQHSDYKGDPSQAVLRGHCCLPPAPSPPWQITRCYGDSQRLLSNRVTDHI